MKLLVTGDKHLGLHSEGVSRLPEQERVVDEILRLLNEEEPDVYVDLGDLFDAAKPGPAATALALRYAVGLADWASGDNSRRGYVLQGNHDVTSRGGTCALDPLAVLRAEDQFYPRVVKEPLVEERDGLVLAFLPYLTAEEGDPQERLDVFARQLFGEDARPRVLAFSHLEIPGAKRSEWDSRQRDVGLAVPSEFLGRDRVRVFAGHVHKFQRFDNVTVVGSAIHVDFAEAVDPKGALLLEVA